MVAFSFKYHISIQRETNFLFIASYNLSKSFFLQAVLAFSDQNDYRYLVGARTKQNKTKMKGRVCDIYQNVD
jgi:hypothetical protein